jgi:predicted MFS family arabinose efflux permease
VYLLILVLSSVASNGVNSQIANILPNVYGIGEATTSGLISLAGVLNIVGFLAAGAWMARSGAMPGFTGAQVMRLAGVLLLALMGLLAEAPVLIVAAAMQLFYFSNPFSRLAQPVLAVQVSTVPAGAASGWVIGAAAVGSFIGSVVGGWLAEAVGFNAINWMGAVAVGAALALLLATLVPAERRRRRAEPEGAGR